VEKTILFNEDYELNGEKNMNRSHLKFFQNLGLVIFLALAGCNLPGSEESQKLDVTQAYQTVEANLTQAATLTPQASPTTVPTQTPTATLTATIAATTAVATPRPANTIAPVVGCDLAAAGDPIDVTIPDDTKMQPGKSFTKTWRLVNAGTCTWNTSYSAAVFSGDGMDAPANVPLPGNVAQGQSVDISVDMVAPDNPGTYLGYWKLKNAAGQWFGIGPTGGAAFWVKIIVEGTPTTITPTVTGTLGPSATPGGIAVQGKVVLSPDDKVDLETLVINSSGNDLHYQMTGGQHLLAPLGNALIGVSSGNPPTYSECKSASLSAAVITLDTFQEGTYFCVKTKGGLTGYTLFSNFSPSDDKITLKVLTWSTQ